MTWATLLVAVTLGPVLVSCEGIQPAGCRASVFTNADVYATGCNSGWSSWFLEFFRTSRISNDDVCDTDAYMWIKCREGFNYMRDRDQLFSSEWRCVEETGSYRAWHWEMALGTENHRMPNLPEKWCTPVVPCVVPYSIGYAFVAGFIDPHDRNQLITATDGQAVAPGTMLRFVCPEFYYLDHESRLRTFVMECGEAGWWIRNIQPICKPHPPFDLQATCIVPIVKNAKLRATKCVRRLAEISSIDAERNLLEEEVQPEYFCIPGASLHIECQTQPSNQRLSVHQLMAIFSTCQDNGTWNDNRVYEEHLCAAGTSVQRTHEIAPSTPYNMLPPTHFHRPNYTTSEVTCTVPHQEHSAGLTGWRCHDRLSYSTKEEYSVVLPGQVCQLDAEIFLICRIHEPEHPFMARCTSNGWTPPEIHTPLCPPVTSQVNYRRQPGRNQPRLNLNRQGFLLL